MARGKNTTSVPAWSYRTRFNRSHAAVLCTTKGTQVRATAEAADTGLYGNSKATQRGGAKQWHSKEK